MSADDTILVRKPCIDDAKAISTYMAEFDVFSNLLQLPHPSLATWVERLSAPPPDSFSLCATRADAFAGLAGLYPDRAGMRRRHVLHLGISVAVPHQGQGVGRRLMTELLSYADNWANCLRVELEVFTDNARAIGLYESLGFVIEGTKRCDALRNGAYVDSHVMGRLHPRPPSVAH